MPQKAVDAYYTNLVERVRKGGMESLTEAEQAAVIRSIIGYTPKPTRNTSANKEVKKRHIFSRAAMLA